MKFHDGPVSEQAKRCTLCGEEKPLEDFYRKPKRSDGRDSRCKICHNAYVERTRDHEHSLIYKREYERSEPAKARVERYRARHPERSRARELLYAAVQRGGVSKPDACEVCGRSDAVIQGHHADYSKPLDVRWLCPVCHGAEHRRLRTLSSEEGEAR